MRLGDSQIQTRGKVVTGTGQSEKEVEGKQDREKTHLCVCLCSHVCRRARVCTYVWRIATLLFKEGFLGLSFLFFYYPKRPFVL